MDIAIRSIGNSKGVVLPKPFLAQAGLDGQATAIIEVENGAIVLRKPAKSVRAGWAAAAAAQTPERAGSYPAFPSPRGGPESRWAAGAAKLQVTLS